MDGLIAGAKPYLDTEIPFLRDVWGFCLDNLGLSTPYASFVVMGLVPMIFFYLYGAFLFCIDMFTSEEFKAKYKVQNNVRVNLSQYMDAFLISVINWVLVGSPYLLFICIVLNPARFKATPAFPTYGTFFRDLGVSVVLEMILFYFSHLALHYPPLYVRIHKFHHSFTAPFGIAAVYAHPVEHIISNVFPLSLGPFIMGSHPTFGMLWGIIALFNTMTVHSGYDLTKFIVFPPPYFHDWHHEKFNENFGTGEIIDAIMGTDKHYREAIARGEVFVPRPPKEIRKKTK